MNKYNNELKEILNKNNFLTINDNYNSLNQYFIEIKKLISEEINDSPNKELLLSTSFFCKSFLTQLLKFKNYIPTNNGDLIVSSENCKFTISEVIMERQTLPEKIFIKVVDYHSQTIHHDNDLLILDVFNAIIFEKLLLVSENQKYRNFIPKFKGSFVSYIKNNWNYNEINYQNQLSPYYYDNILSGNSPYYRQKALVLMTESINIVSVLTLFLEYNFDSSNPLHINRVSSVISKFADLYDFIKYIGYTYGFMHNDLHMGNVVYDISNDRLVLIDFGKSAFKKFLLDVDPELNNSLMSEFSKLDCSELLKNAKIKNYVDLFNNSSLYNNTFSIESNGYYFGVIFDLITYSMNVYMKTIYYFKKVYTPTVFNVLMTDFFKLIKVNYDTFCPEDLLHNEVTLNVPATVEELIQNYISLKQTFVLRFNDEKVKKLINFICEGSFYMGLYMHFINFKTVDVKSNYYIYSGFHILRDNLKDFHAYILRVLTPFANEIRPIDNFLVLFIPQTGGLTNISQSKLISKSLFIRKRHSSVYDIKLDNYVKITPYQKLTIEDTVKLYKKYFDEKNTYIIPYNRKLDKFRKIKFAKRKTI
jgi:hypothetical protein